MSGITTLDAHLKASATHVSKLIFFRINIMGINIHHIVLCIIFVSIYIILNLSFVMAKLKIYWFCSAQFHMHEKSADSISHGRKV